MFLEHRLGGAQIGAAAEGLDQPVVVDLGDVDGGVPGRQQGRGADGAAQLLGQDLQVVAEHRAGVAAMLKAVADDEITGPVAFRMRMNCV